MGVIITIKEETGSSEALASGVVHTPKIREKVRKKVRETVRKKVMI
jgi:hypothetical protein